MKLTEPYFFGFLAIWVNFKDVIGDNLGDNFVVNFRDNLGDDIWNNFRNNFEVKFLDLPSNNTFFGVLVIWVDQMKFDID